MQPNTLIIFIRYPEAGLVKTRLARSIGVSKAALLYRLFVEALLKRTDDKNFQRIIFYTPDNKKGEIIHWLGKDITVRPQKGDALGERLSRAFELTFKNGAKRVVAIGTDSPLLDKKDIKSAFEVLKDKQCVLGPSLDGGYYLLGLSFLNKWIFKGISWGTKKVFGQTMNRLIKTNTSYGLLGASFDVDTYKDLLMLKQRLQDSHKINPYGLDSVFSAVDRIIDKAKM